MNLKVIWDKDVPERKLHKNSEFTAFLLFFYALYATIIWFGLQFHGPQSIVSGYFITAFMGWRYGITRGMISAITAILVTLLVLQLAPSLVTLVNDKAAFLGCMVFTLIALLGGNISNLYSKLYNTQKEVEREHAKSEMLLKNILPESIASRLKAGEALIADRYAESTILFCDLVGFTQLTHQMGPEKVVHLLNDVITIFDDLSDSFNIEKIKTIGDAYLVVSGLPDYREDHAYVMAQMALSMNNSIQSINDKEDTHLELRIGLHSGPVIGGVIGKNKFTFDIWGDTVNLASRLETHGTAGKIHISENTYEIIKDKFECESCGVIDLKSYGEQNTYFLLGEK